MYPLSVEKVTERIQPCQRKIYQIVVFTKGNTVLPEGETIPDWTPYQLRHTAATETSRTVGKEKAKALLAHRSMRTTEIYDHSDLAVREELARNRWNPLAEEPTNRNDVAK